jgi:hypothetical protein
MMISRRMSLVVAIVVAAGIGASAQVHKYFTPGSVWTITTIRVKPGMDQAYLAYLNTTWRQTEEATVKAGYQKSYKVLRTMDDDGGYNFILMREYSSLGSMEANVEKADALAATVIGDDTKQMQGYEDRSKVREVVGTRTVRELMLK